MKTQFAAREKDLHIRAVQSLLLHKPMSGHKTRQIFPLYYISKHTLYSFLKPTLKNEICFHKMKSLNASLCSGYRS